MLSIPYSFISLKNIAKKLVCMVNLEDSYEDWYVDSRNFWEDNYFQSILHHMKSNLRRNLDELFALNGYTYLDPHEHGGNLNHNTHKEFMQLRYCRWVSRSTQGN